MEPGDIASCLAFWRDTEGLVIRDDSDQPETIERFLHRNPGLSLIAEEAGEIVAAVLCGHDGRCAHLYHLAVQADRRRSGCASALMEAVWAALRAEGITHCQAYVRARNLTAMQFWDQYQPERRREVDLVRFKLR